MDLLQREVIRRLMSRGFSWVWVDQWLYRPHRALGMSPDAWLRAYATGGPTVLALAERDGDDDGVW